MCDDMVAALRAFQSEADFEWRLLDVDADPSRRQAFGDKVPVLLHGDTELCHYFLDPSALRAVLAAEGA